MARFDNIKVGDWVVPNLRALYMNDQLTVGKMYRVTEIDEEGDPWFVGDNDIETYLINNEDFCEIENIVTGEYEK